MNFSCYIFFVLFVDKAQIGLLLYNIVEYDPYLQPVNKEVVGVLTPVGASHALGHVMSNVLFAAVAVSFTHTIKGNYCKLIELPNTRTNYKTSSTSPIILKASLAKSTDVQTVNDSLSA